MSNKPGLVPNPESLSEADWKSRLEDMSFQVLRKHATERAFTGSTWDLKASGTYYCSGCGQPLFRSETKYDSGTGWPSFYQPISPDAVGTQAERKFFMLRTEVHCPRCKGHLGHVFEDGPAPTNLRYCMNSASMSFVKDE